MGKGRTHSGWHHSLDLGPGLSKTEEERELNPRRVHAVVRTVFSSCHFGLPVGMDYDQELQGPHKLLFVSMLSCFIIKTERQWVT